jgi:hypothetical protein
VAKENGIVLLPPLLYTHWIALSLVHTKNNACLNDLRLFNPCTPATIYSTVGILARSFSMAFTKHNTGNGSHVTRIYPLRGNIFDQDKFLSYDTDRP